MTLDHRIAEWTGWAMGRVLDWIQYTGEFKDANLKDWKARDIQRHELADEVTEIERRAALQERVIKRKNNYIAQLEAELEGK